MNVIRVAIFQLTNIMHGYDARMFQPERGWLLRVAVARLRSPRNAERSSSTLNATSRPNCTSMRPIHNTHTALPQYFVHCVAGRRNRRVRNKLLQP